MQKNRKILVTTALPYANGSLHLGHLLEEIQADIWVRFQKMLGNECLFICGDDAHGTPIMLSAQRQNISPEELIKKFYDEHKKDFFDFHINFDNYYTTHSPENQKLVETIYARLKENDDISVRTIKQAYDPKAKMFLPDRYIKGQCPKCGAKDQYGDNCEVCSSTYSPLDLIDPVSVISGEKPIEKESEHYFFKLPKYTELLQTWITGEHFQIEVSNKLQEWFKNGLQEWDVSRDSPYFGFPIPDAPDKYFYVWLDAPIGYIASFENYCATHPEIKFDEYWSVNSTAELYHFIGKDIINFHALFWPAMLNSAKLRLPTAIYTHGYLTIEGQKMSKSRGTYISARDYLNHLNPEYIRYYFAAKLNDNVEDIDLNLADFSARVNSDLVGKVINIASRCASFIHKYFNGKLSNQLADPALFKTFVEAGDEIQNYYENREFARAVRKIMELADLANQYIDQHKPWSLIKTPGEEVNVQNICSFGINLFYLLITYLKPILPDTAQKSEHFLNINPLTWENRKSALLNHTIGPFTPLLNRITPENITALKNASTHTTT